MRSAITMTDIYLLLHFQDLSLLPKIRCRLYLMRQILKWGLLERKPHASPPLSIWFLIFRCIDYRLWLKLFSLYQLLTPYSYHGALRSWGSAWWERPSKYRSFVLISFYGLFSYVRFWWGYAGAQWVSLVITGRSFSLLLVIHQIEMRLKFVSISCRCWSVFGSDFGLRNCAHQWRVWHFSSKVGKRAQNHIYTYSCVSKFTGAFFLTGPLGAAMGFVLGGKKRKRKKSDDVIMTNYSLVKKIPF